MSAIFPLWRPFTPDSGHAFLTGVPPALAKMIARGEFFVSVLEDGVDLGPGDASHDAIRELGGGRYSLWGESLWFSASDNSDCANNGRAYSVMAVDISDRSSLYRTVVDRAVPDDATLLSIVAQNAQRNNSVFGNFFRHRNAMQSWLDRTGAGLPRRIVEVGCGAIPWTGLRFLLEGTELFVATDMIKVQDSFPATQMRDLRVTCDQFDASLTARWDAVLPPGEQNIRPRGLSVQSETGFETIVLEDEVDFIMSTAVLEHVMDPDGVYRKMAEVTPRGGWMFHAIDLRDHRHFDADPLAFLMLTEAEYAPIKSENRLRASHHRALMDAHGFDVVVEMGYVLGPDGRHSWVERGNDFTPGVTEAQRERFTPEFRGLDLLDLSTTSVQMLCRRR
jgi:SAM-dependent methyltransferase